jgi:hypothetical protein
MSRGSSVREKLFKGFLRSKKKKKKSLVNASILNYPDVKTKEFGGIAPHILNWILSLNKSSLSEWQNRRPRVLRASTGAAA